MPDPNISAGPDVRAMILGAESAAWEKIRKGLQVETREQAASMVEVDDKARLFVLDVFAGAEGGEPVKRRSVITDSRTSQPPLAEQMYGKGKAKVEF